MKKEAKLLLGKSVNSLILSVDHFNRPWNQGRTEAFLILLDHAFEMFLKAAILHKGGRIREPRAKHTLGFAACVRKGLSDGDIKFLTEEEALTLQMTNSVRDAAQHHLLDISEQQLYIHAQLGLTLFRDLYSKVFSGELARELPQRVLPISTGPPTDLATFFDRDVDAVRVLLGPGRRRRIEARNKTRALAILDRALSGEDGPPGERELNQLLSEIQAKPWEQVFFGVAAVSFTVTGNGPSLDLRITKKEGVPINLVPEGSPGAIVVAVRRVDELGFYNLGRDQIAEKVGLTGPKTTATIRYLKLQDDPDCFKRVKVGKVEFDRYSQRAIDRIKDALTKISIEDVWAQCRPRTKSKYQAAAKA